MSTATAEAETKNDDHDDTITDTNAKCPCCKTNPWSAATGDIFAKLCMDCQQEKEEGEKGNKNETKSSAICGLDRSNMDNTVSPCDNFYLYANGGWMKHNEIPSEYPSWNTFMMLHTLSQERLKALLEEEEEKIISSKTTQQSSSSDNTSSCNSTNSNSSTSSSKVAMFYSAAMNEDRIEADGIEPMKDLLDLCEKASLLVQNDNLDTSALATVLGQILSQFGVTSFFSIGSSPDNINSTHSICQLSQGGLGLPDRDYYFDQDKEDKRIAYKKHIALMLTLLDDDPSAPAALSFTEQQQAQQEQQQIVPSTTSIANANLIYDLEYQIAEKHMTKTQNRDPEATYNKMTLDELSSRTNHIFDFESFLHSATGKTSQDMGHVNVRNTQALDRIATLLSNIDSHTLHQYLRWRAIRSCAPYLPKRFVQQDFDFNEKLLSGTKEIKPRWKRAMTFTEHALGEELGQLYCAKYFDESSKEKALQIVESVRSALEERLQEVDWMTSHSTREAALRKMNSFKVKIGYPDKWIDYSTLHLQPQDSFLSMIFKSRHFELQRDITEMNAPTDKDKWFLTPQTVNAYYHPNLNEIVFPAAILQPPFFDPNADNAVNYGSMGAVVGHEMTHGFDDQGRKFNAEGNMIDWWTEQDGEEYTKRVEVMVQQANQFQVHGQSVQGKLTCGENIADLGGLRLALRALNNNNNSLSSSSSDNTNNISIIDGFTSTQRFFLGWAQCWRQNITKERSLQLLTLDPHGPNELRCNGPLSNIPEFHDAFQVKEGDPMFKKVEYRVDIW